MSDENFIHSINPPDMSLIDEVDMLEESPLQVEEISPEEVEEQPKLRGRRSYPTESLKGALKLAIIGRPNVGKSALFNRICQRKIAIVHEQEGTTRDRIYGRGLLYDFPFIVIDTGGMDSQSSDPLSEKIINQAQVAIAEADTLVLVVDGKVGITALDEQIAKLLLKTTKPVILAINKIDAPEEDILVHNFYSLGIKKTLPISALQDLQINKLLEMAWEGFTLLPAQMVENRVCKLAILGRPNVGKSTLINALLNDQRVIESPIAGTTTDAIDIPCTISGKEYLLIDTAGVKRKKKERELVDKLATFKRERAIDRADICIVVCNAAEGITHEEKKIVNEIEEAGKGCIILFNKWDLVKGFRMEHCQAALREENSFLSNIPLLFISAKIKRNLDKVIRAIEKVQASYESHLSTPALNRYLRKAYEMNSPPVIDSKRLTIHYMTQVGTAPPRFILFVNNPFLMSGSYKKYLINQMRKTFPLTGVPVDFILKGKKSK